MEMNAGNNPKILQVKIQRVIPPFNKRVTQHWYPIAKLVKDNNHREPATQSSRSVQVIVVKLQLAGEHMIKIKNL